MERTIKVTGKGNISVRPDRIRLLLNMEGIQSSYEQTMELSTHETGILRDMFEGLGFDKSDLKTLYFSIDTKYENYQAKDKSWKKRFEGYEYHHNMKIEFDADNDRLGRVLYAMVNSSVCPEFRIIYTIKDKESAKNQLLGKAVTDSKEKARVLTEAAGVTLGEIQLIDYSWGEIEVISSPMNRCMEPMALDECCMSEAKYNMDIEPEDIEVSDTVTVVWSLR